MVRPERPKKPDNLTMGDFFYEETRYKEDLEKYCDGLENYSDGLEKAIALLEKAVLKLDNSLNEACKILSRVEMDSGWYCPYNKFDSVSCKCCDDLKCHEPEAIKDYLSGRTE